MISDKQIKKYMRCRLEMTQEKAALKSGISPNTARKYEKLKQLPSDIQLAQNTKEPAHSHILTHKYGNS